MPTFKQYLDALFKTRTTPAEAAAASAPALDNPVTLFDGIMGGVPSRTFTAPFDGYVVATANSAVSEAELTLQASANTAYKVSGDFVATGWGLGLFLPLKKGESFIVQMIGINQIQVRMYRLVGGGYRLLLKALQSGGATCLRLRNTFARFSSKATHNLCRHPRQPKLLRWTDSGMKSSRRVMGMGCSQRRQPILGILRSSITTLVLTQRLPIRLQVLRHLFRLRRAQVSIIGLRTHKVPQQWKSDFSLSSVLPSFSANCEEVCHVA